MDVALGIDTLCYHCRIDAGEIAVEQVMRESAELGASFVQVNAVHIRGRSDAQLEELRELANSLALSLTLAGDVVGVAGRGDSVEDGAARVSEWIRMAGLLGSPYARMSSGFYRAELWREPALIEAEKQYMISALGLAADRNGTGIRILLENHSDFTPDEYVDIIQTLGPERVGVFLDVINPVSVFAEPLPVVRKLFPWAYAGHVKDFRLVSNFVPGGFHRTGFDVKWCYPGEGVADIAALLGVITTSDREGLYLLSVEGLDSRAGVADQRERLTTTLSLLRDLLPLKAPAR
jgi:sugar phosphate isomerase/epimerase